MRKDFSMLSKELMESEDYFLERFTRMQAYIDLCLLAEWKERKFLKRGIVVELKPGQLAKSEDELAARWKWSRNTVRKFLFEQQMVGNIEQQKSRLITVITVKFGLMVAQQNEQQNGTKVEQQNEQLTIDSNINNKKKEDTNVSKKELEQMFEIFRQKYKSYGGKVRGFEVELKDFKKKHKDWEEVIPILGYAIDKEAQERSAALRRGDFFPQIKNLKTYLNQRSWECYSDGFEDYNPNEYHPQDMNYDAEFKAYRFYGLQPDGYLEDGYDEDNRPDGARVVSQFFVWEWRKATKSWEEVK